MTIDAALKQARFARLAENLQKQALEAVAIVPGANFYYLTGVHFHLMERPTLFVVTHDGGKHAIIPALEKLRWSALAPDVETIYWQDSEGYTAAFARLAKRINLRKIGVEGQRMRVFEAHALRDALPGLVVIDAHAGISAMRLCKDDAEIATLLKAIEISERALSDTIAKVSVGMSETQILSLIHI